MAFILFLMLKAVNKLLTIGKKKKEEIPAVTGPSDNELLQEILKELKKKSK
jgi:large conductance mechanosensitive channel